MAQGGPYAFPPEVAKGHRRFAWMSFGLLAALGVITALGWWDQEDSREWAAFLSLVVVFGAIGWHSWRTAAWFVRFRVAIDAEGLAVDGKRIPWSAIARVRERGFGVDLLDAERLSIVHLRYWLVGFEDLLVEIFRHRPDLLEDASTLSRVGNVSIGSDRLEIAAKIRPKSIPIDQLERPALQLALHHNAARLEVWVDWPGGETSRLRIPSHDPIQLWIALRRAIRGPAIPAI